jgi:hypothetical protein
LDTAWGWIVGDTRSYWRVTGFNLPMSSSRHPQSNGSLTTTLTTVARPTTSTTARKWSCRAWSCILPGPGRTFGETRRRVKVIGRLPGEHSCLKLVWAVLDRASAGWRGFTMTPAGLRLLQDLRRSLHDPPTQLPQRNSEAHIETTVAPTDSVGAIA